MFLTFLRVFVAMMLIVFLNVGLISVYVAFTTENDNKREAAVVLAFCAGAALAIAALFSVALI